MKLFLEVFFICFTFIAITNSEKSGGWQDNSNPNLNNQAYVIANWFKDSLSTYAGENGDSYNLNNLTNLSTQIVSGTNYKFTASYKSSANNYVS